MDRSYPAQHKLGDLRQSRSKQNSQTSYSQTRVDDLNLNIAAALNAQAFSHQESISSSVPSLSTNPSSETNSPAFLTCPVPTFPTGNHLQNLQNWPFLESCENAGDPLLSFAQHQQLPTSGPTNISAPPPTGAFTREEMSTLGIQFDPHFDASIRPTYSWPADFDINEQYSQGNNSNMNTFNMTTNNNLPSFTRSFSSSPPQAMFTPEQRELKRQRDLARRGSKAQMRRDRSASNSYNGSQNTTPDMLPRTIANYSSTIVASSIPAASSPPFTNSSYMPSLAPQMTTSESPELYGASFPTMISNDYNLNNYLGPFSSAPEPSIPYTTIHGRSHSLSSASAPDSQYYRASALASHPHSHSQEHISSSSETVRIVHSRPKPQCWDHGCNGRQFSTFSNLLRHQREKSGVASKPTCLKCGAEFTRTTARNGHMAHEKCKQRRNS